MTILGFVEWLGQGVVEVLAGCAAAGIAALAGRALAAETRPVPRSIPVRARRR